MATVVVVVVVVGGGCGRLRRLSLSKPACRNQPVEITVTKNHFLIIDFTFALMQIIANDSLIHLK